MGIIEATRNLGVEIQKDERYKKYASAKAKNDNDFASFAYDLKGYKWKDKKYFENLSLPSFCPIVIKNVLHEFGIASKTVCVP